MQAPLSRETRRSGGEIRAHIGHQIWDSSTLPQVTGLAPNRPKIVRVFEFMSLTSAPGRIRTCAHGSGGRSCSRLPPGKTRAGVPVGERMGGARLAAGSARRFPGCFRVAASMVPAVGRLAGAY